MAAICFRTLKHRAGRSHRDLLGSPCLRNRAAEPPIISLCSRGDSLLDARLLSSFGVLPP